MQKKPELFILALILGAGFIFKNEVEAAVTSSGDWFTRYDADFKAASKKYGIPWRWIKAVSMNESLIGTARSVAYGILNPQDVEGSKSSDGKSWGLMQTTLATSRELIGAPITQAYLNVPKNSIDLGSRYLRQMWDRFSKYDEATRREYMVRAYNGGPGFLNTNLGRTATPIYYAKFVTNLGTVMSRQPGNEKEIG